MTFHLFIAAFVGATVTLVALVSLAKGPLDLSPLIQGLGLGRRQECYYFQPKPSKQQHSQMTATLKGASS